MAIAQQREIDSAERFLSEHLLEHNVRVVFSQQFLKHREPSLDLIRVTGVHACGSQAQISFEDDRVLIIDLLATGRWRAYPHGTDWDRPRVRARVIFHTDTHQIAAFSAPLVVLCGREDPACTIHCAPRPGATTHV